MTFRTAEVNHVPEVPLISAEKKMHTVHCGPGCSEHIEKGVSTHQAP